MTDPVSWREALTESQAGVGRAYEHRRVTVQAAWDAGLSFRQIADVVGMSVTGVFQIIGKQSSRRDPNALLDSPAFTPTKKPSRREDGRGRDQQPIGGCDDRQ